MGRWYHIIYIWEELEPAIASKCNNTAATLKECQLYRRRLSVEAVSWEWVFFSHGPCPASAIASNLSRHTAEQYLPYTHVLWSSESGREASDAGVPGKQLRKPTSYSLLASTQQGLCCQDMLVFLAGAPYILACCCHSTMQLARQCSPALSSHPIPSLQL